MARRVSGWGYDYGSGGGGGGGFSYGMGRGPDPGMQAADDFMEGFSALGKVLVARRGEKERERRSAEIYQRQNTKHIPEAELSKYRQEWESTLPDPKLRKSPEGVFGFTDYAIKEWDKKKAEAAAAQKAEQEAQQRFEQETKDKERLESGFRGDQEKARDAAVKEARRLEQEGVRYEQARRAAEATNARARMSAARAGMDPSTAVTVQGPDAPLGVQMKRVPVYDVVDEFADPRYGTAAAARYVDIPITDERTFLTSMEERALRGGPPAPAAAPVLEPAVQPSAQPAQPRAQAPRTAAQLRDAAAAPARPPAAPARPTRPDAPPFPQPRTPEQVYENRLWSDAVKESRKAVRDAEAAWSGTGGGVNAAALESHAQSVLDEYLGWRAASGLEDLDERGQRAVKESVKSQLRGYGGGANRGRQVLPGVQLPGEPVWKSSQPFGLDDATRNAIAAEAWTHPSREYPGLYQTPTRRPGPAAPRPQAPAARKEEEGWFDRALSGTAAALGLSVDEEDLRSAQSTAAQSRIGAVQPEAPAARTATLLPGMGMMPGQVRASDEMTPAELTQYREVQKEQEGLKNLATHAANVVLRSGGTREQAIAAATQAAERQATNLAQQFASKNHMLAAPASERIALQIDEALSPRNAAKMAVQAAVTAAATYLTGGGALAVGLGAGAGSLAGQALLNKPGEAIDPRAAALEAATVGIASKIPLGGVERVAGALARPLGRVAPAVGTAAAGAAREAVQEMSEAGIQAGLEGRAPTGEELAVSGIVGGIYGPLMEGALRAGRGATNPAARGNPTVPPSERAAAIAQAIRADIEGAAGGAPTAPAPGTTIEQGFAANRAEADAAIRATLDPDEVAFLEANGLLAPAAPAAQPGGGEVDAMLAAMRGQGAPPAAPGAPTAPTEPTGPQTAADLAAAAATATAPTPPGTTPRPRGRRGGRTQPPPTAPGPTEAAPTAPVGAEGLAPALQQPDFSAWVDQMLGPGTFEGLTTEFRATGDGSALADLRRAYATSQTAGGDPVAARGLADIAQSPLSKNALAEQARQFEQRRLAEVRARQLTQPDAAPYSITRGEDGQFYVMTVSEPAITEREAAGERAPRPGGRRAIAGPFTSPEAAQQAATNMQGRFQSEVAPTLGEQPTPSETLRAEREQARQLYRTTPRELRGANRNVGTGRPSPAVLEPGTEARLRAEAQAAVAAAQAAQAAAAVPAKGKKGKAKAKGKKADELKAAAAQAAAPAAAPTPGKRTTPRTATPTLEGRPRTTADLKAAQKRAEAKRKADEAAAAARAKEQAGVEPGEPDEGELLSMLRDVVGTANNAGDLASMLGITTEEAEALLGGRDAADRLSGTTMMADPFGVGVIQQILDRRAIARAKGVMEANQLFRQRRREGRAAAAAKGPRTTGTLAGAAERAEWQRATFNRITNSMQNLVDDMERAGGSMPDIEVEDRPGGMRIARQYAMEPGQMDVWSEENVQAFEDFVRDNPRDPYARAAMRPSPGVDPQEAWDDAFIQWSERNDPGQQRVSYVTLQSPGFVAEMVPGGVITTIATNPDASRFAGAADLMRGMQILADEGGRFEQLQNISPDTEKIYRQVEALTGYPWEDLPGKTVAEVLETPVAQARMRRFAAREAAQIPKAQGATADFMGLQQSWENVKAVARSAQQALGVGGAAAASTARRPGGVARALMTGPRSTLEHTRELGPNGAAIADLMEVYRDAREGLRGRWWGSLDSALAKVPADQRGAVIDLLEGKQRATSPEVTQAVQQIRETLNEISRLAMQNERTTGYLADYFPRILATRPNLAQKAKAAAVDLWKEPQHKANMQAMGVTNPATDAAAANYAAAVLMFPGGRLYGGVNPNLERHRTGMLSEYRTDPEVLYQYISGASRSIAQAMVWDSPRLTGPSAQGKTMDRFGGWKQAWADTVMKDGADEQTVEGLRGALEREMGINQPIDKTGTQQMAQDVTDIVASTSLALSFLQQPLSFADTAATMGAGPAMQGLLSARGQQAESAAVRAGSVPSRGAAEAKGYAEEQTLSQQPAGGKQVLSRAAKLYRELPWMNWMQEIDRANRVIADSAARQSLKSVIDGINSGDAATLSLLKAAGVDPAGLAGLSAQDIAAAASYGQMTPQAQTKVDQYARRMTEFTQQRARAGDLPKSWSTPLGRAVSMFMPFKYRQAKNMMKAFKANPARFIASGFPAYLFLGSLAAAARSILTGYGYEGEELEGDPIEKLQRVWGNKRIAADSPEEYVLQGMQSLVRAAPTPFALGLTSRFERAKDAGSILSSVVGPTSRVAEAAGTALTGLHGAGRPGNISRGEYAARGLGTAAFQLLGPSAYSYQLKSELMGQQSPYPKKEIAVSPAPGLVGRALDLARGEITGGQFVEGVVKGGKGTLSKRRKQRRENIRENRRRSGRDVAKDAREYTTIRAVPEYR